MDQQLIAFGKVYSDLLSNGISVFAPVLKTDAPFDIIFVSPGGRLYRTSVRYRAAQRGKLEIALKDSEKNSVDLVAVYSPDTDRVYYLLSQEINKAVSLRLDKPDRSVPGLRLAEDYVNINRLFAEEFMFDIQVMGHTLRKYSKNGQFWVEAPDGKSFKIILENKSPVRKKYVVSVDGLNVIDGKEASVDGSGYIVPPFSTVVVDGWRMNYNEVSEFFFTKKENSYSELKGDGVENCGVIGVAVFDEKVVLRAIEPILYASCDQYSVSGNNMTLGAVGDYREGLTVTCADVSHKMGTGWGETKESKVFEASFNAKDKPTYTMSVFYDSRENLIARGIIQADSKPKAFPASREFCQAP